MTTAEKPSIVEALSAVMGDVQAVGKTGRNTQQGYNFRGIDAVVNAVGPALRAHGVVVVPIDSRYDAEHYDTKSGTSMRGITATVTFRFYGPAGDHIDAQVCGESSDAGDKAVPKAHSVAFRTMLLEALCIPTGEPDPDESSHERAVRGNGPAVVAIASREEAGAIVKSFGGEAWRGKTVAEIAAEPKGKNHLAWVAGDEFQPRGSEQQHFKAAVRVWLDIDQPAAPETEAADPDDQIPF